MSLFDISQNAYKVAGSGGSVLSLYEHDVLMMERRRAYWRLPQLLPLIYEMGIRGSRTSVNISPLTIWVVLRLDPLSFPEGSGWGCCRTVESSLAVS